MEGDTELEQALESAVETAIDIEGAGEGKGSPALEPSSSNTSPAPSPTPEVVAPKTWRAEAAAQYAQLPEWARQEIEKREDDMFKGLEQYKQGAQFGTNMQQALAPYMPMLQQYGVDPAQQVGQLMAAYQTLNFGSPEQKAQLARQIIQDYNLDPTQLTAEQYVDPQVKSLQNQLHAVQSQLNQTTQRDFAVQKAKVEAFANDPKNIHFNEVADTVAALIKSGTARSIDQAYEMAVWMNPATRAKEMQRQQEEALKKQKSVEAERAAKSKAATAANVQTEAKRGSPTAPLGSMMDTINETAAAIAARNK